MVMVGFLKLGSEDDHHPVLQEVVILRGIRVEALVLKVTNPRWDREYLITE